MIIRRILVAMALPFYFPIAFIDGGIKAIIGDIPFVVEAWHFIMTGENRE